MSEISFLVTGFVFGLSGGITPGPLLTLVVSQTLRHGIREGFKVAVAPLLTDLPIVLGAIFLVSNLSDIEPALGIVSLLGGCFLAYLGIGSLIFKGAEIAVEAPAPRSLRKGVLTNLLNPSPYVFWTTIGAPLALDAAERSAPAVALFFLSFYVLLVGCKMLTALLAGKSRRFLKSRNYVFTIRALGAVLLVYAAIFLRSGLSKLME